jgi:hypothetical protein
LIAIRKLPGDLIAYAGWVHFDWTSEALAKGLTCYQKAEFFLAHEHWESVWLTLEEPEKSFLQALIQTAAAFHHLERGNPAGAISLLRRALRRLELCSSCFGGIAITPLCTDIVAWLGLIEKGTAAKLPAFPQIRPVDLNRD